jgi:hypothetical protein
MLLCDQQAQEKACELLGGEESVGFPKNETMSPQSKRDAVTSLGSLH